MNKKYKYQKKKRRRRKKRRKIREKNEGRKEAGFQIFSPIET